MNDKPLIHYNAARKALAKAKSIDEVRGWRNRAAALVEYGRQAKDDKLVEDAMDIKKRAECRAGEILQEMNEAGERRAQGVSEDPQGTRPPTLKQLGITANQSARWQRLSRMSPEELEAHIAEVKRWAVKGADGRVERAEEKKRLRAEKEAALAAQIRALPTKRYGVILADPAWDYAVWNPESGSDRAAANHYATTVLDKIKSRDVQGIAADDCVLALWATVPMLPEALEVMEAWGFDYKSHSIWLKDKVGTGYWFRNSHELLLIGTRGQPVAPAPGTQWESAWEADVGEHSAKPIEAYRLLEHYFPNVPKIELDARGARDGWDRHGAEAPLDLEAAE